MELTNQDRFFAPIAAPEVVRFDPAKTRVVKLEKEAMVLPVPGLRELKSVRIGTYPFDQSYGFETPLDPQGTRMIPHSVPLFRVVTEPDGGAALQRCVLSNHGYFQPGDWYITGAFDAAVSPEPEAIPEPVPPPPRSVVFERTAGRTGK